MENRLLKYVLVVVVMLCGCPVWAQNDIAHVFGQLKDQTTKKKLEGVDFQDIIKKFIGKKNTNFVY